MLVVGLTGSIASGKSTVAQFLKQQGALVYDADVIAHQCYEPGTAVYDSRVLEFGKDILEPNGKINRAKLGEIVFSQRQKREKLNQLVHPAVIAKVKEIIKAYKKEPPAKLLVFQVPLLIEAKMQSLFNVIVVIVTSPEAQYQRLQKQGFSEAQILARLQAQLPDSERLKYADFTIINKGTKELLQKNTKVLLSYLQSA
jgi:dephospho-CoA kinase